MINDKHLVDSPRSKAFVDEIYEATSEHPFVMCNRVLMDDGPIAEFELVSGHKDGEIMLGFIGAFKKGNGHGTKALKWFLDIAKRHKMMIHINVDRQGDKGLTQAQLKRWYKRHGFTFPHNGRDGYVDYGSTLCRPQTRSRCS